MRKRAVTTIFTGKKQNPELLQYNNKNVQFSNNSNNKITMHNKKSMAYNQENSKQKLTEIVPKCFNQKINIAKQLLKVFNELKEIMPKELKERMAKIN